MDGNDGDVFKSTGGYNGWFVGMTKVRAMFYAYGASACLKLIYVYFLLRNKQQKRKMEDAAGVRTTSTSKPISSSFNASVDPSSLSLHQLFNGWIQGISPSDVHMGKYFNLDVCK